MRVVLAYEAHFVRGPDGVYTEHAYPYPYWQRFLSVFEEVIVVARVEEGRVPGPTARRADGPGVRFAAMPYYLGGAAFLRTLPSLDRAVRLALDHHPDAAVILRVPGLIGTVLWNHLLLRRWAYGVQVVGDPWESARGVSTLAELARLPLAVQLRLQVLGASAATYSTRASLQRRYPARARTPSFAVSDVDLPDALFDEPAVPIRDAPRPLRIGFVGSLNQRYKGLDVLLDALASLRAALPCTLTVVGDGAHRGELEAHAQRVGLADAVDFRGALPAGAPVLAALREQDLFVLPARTEGLPRAVIEAMAVGLPCLATTVGGIPELLAPTEMVPPDDVAALAAAIAALAADAPRRRALAARNRDVAREYRTTARDATLRRFYEAVRAGRLMA